jgi:signal transduction histidine kinase
MMRLINLTFGKQSVHFIRMLLLLSATPLIAQNSLKSPSTSQISDTLLLKQYEAKALDYFKLRQSEKAYPLICRGLQLAHTSGNELYQGIFTYLIGKYHKANWRLDSSNVYLDKALRIFEHCKVYTNYSAAMYTKAVNYFDKQEQAKAVTQLLALVRFNEQHKVETNTASAYNLLSITFGRLNDTLNEKKFLLKFIEIAQRENSANSQQIAYGMQGEFLMRQHKPSEALASFVKAYSLAQTLKDTVSMVDVLNYMGFIHLSGKHYKKSLALFRLTEKISLRYQHLVGWNAPLSYSYAHISSIFLAAGKSDTALNYARRSLALIEKTPLRYEFMVESLKSLVAAQKAMGHYRDALRSYERLRELIQSVDNTKNREITKGIEAKYQLERIQKQNELYQQNLKINELALQNEQKQRRLLELMIIFLILIVAGGYWFFQKNQLYNQQISQKNQELELSNETKDKLFGIIGHDLRTPVADLNNSLTVIEGKKVTEEQFYSLIDLLRKKATSLQTILNNLLYWALSQRHTLHTNPQSIPLKSKIEEVLESLQGLIQEKSLQIEELTNTAAIIKADENHAQIVLYNIIHNAIKFSPVGETIRFKITSQADLVELQVTNSGNPFEWNGSPETLSALPSQFGTLNEKGTGLGLLVCTELMKLNGGTVRAYFADPTGTTLALHFPKSAAVA